MSANDTEAPRSVDVKLAFLGAEYVMHITQDGPPTAGDVDGNGIVNGADVTALYNYLLNGTPVAGDPNVDGDYDGVVNGADVTALYTLLLN